MARSFPSLLFNVLLPAFLAVYIVIRIGMNTFSWDSQGGESAAGSVIGDRYAALLAGQEAPEFKIQPLWKLTTDSGWILPAWSGDPRPLAGVLSDRVKSYARNGNIPQAASHLKILLLWSRNLLTATGPGAAPSHALDVTEIAIASLTACPDTLRYAELGSLVKSLSGTLAEASRIRLSNQLADLSESETGDTPRNLRLLANRNVLRGDLLNALDGHRENSTRLTLKSWLLVCPRNPRLLQEALQILDTAGIRSQQLRHQIDALPDSALSPASS